MPINPKERVRQATEKAKKFRSEVRGHIVTAIATAFALVIALAWQDTIKTTVDKLLEGLAVTQTAGKLVQYTLIYKGIIAIAITIICVIGIMLVSRWGQKKE